jgi:malic enzyme
MSIPQPGKDELLARAGKPGEEALRLHPFYRGKMQTTPKCAIRGFEDFAIWYSPGVAAPCRAIQKDPDLLFAHTNKANSIAIVTDGTRVLGLGDIGPDAGLPVMEGKAAQAEGVARLQRSHSELQLYAAKLMREARETTRVLMREGLIAAPPGP